MKPEIGECRYRAACFVSGSAMHKATKRHEPLAGEWHQRFRGHPWVEASIKEGWARDLRMHVKAEVVQRMLREQDYGDIASLMPDAKWVEEARKQAERERLAREWRESVIAEYGSMDEYWKQTKHMPRVSDFQPLSAQAASRTNSGNVRDFTRNVFRKIEPSDEEQLTDLSRRMTGDRE